MVVPSSMPPHVRHYLCCLFCLGYTMLQGAMWNRIGMDTIAQEYLWPTCLLYKLLRACLLHKLLGLLYIVFSVASLHDHIHFFKHNWNNDRLYHINIRFASHTCICVQHVFPLFPSVVTFVPDSGAARFCWVWDDVTSLPTVAQNHRKWAKLERKRV